MIFGFNTDIKQGDTVYHVQSEARESELLLQTQVFVRGRCIGKRATSYAETDLRAEVLPTSRRNRSCAIQHRHGARFDPRGPCSKKFLTVRIPTISWRR